jgi:hypothetical protein
VALHVGTIFLASLILEKTRCAVGVIEEPKIQHQNKNKNKNHNNKSVVVLLTTFVYWFLVKTITAREGARFFASQPTKWQKIFTTRSSLSRTR